MMRYMVMVGIGLLSIVTGLVAFFLLADATRKAILESIVIDSTSHKKYDDWTSDWNDGDQALYQKYYLWNLTNPAEFAVGESKAVLVEVGPFVYRLYGNKSNVTFGDGGNEVSYNEYKDYIFQPDMSVSDDQDTMILNINPFYVAAIAKTGGSEAVFDLSLAAGAFLEFNDTTAWGSGTPAGASVPGFFQAFGGSVSLTDTEATVALTAFAGKLQNLAGYAKLVGDYSTVLAAGQTATAALLAQKIDSTFPGGPDFRSTFSFDGSLQTKATLVITYAANIGAGARAAMVADGAGANGGLLYRSISARAHLFGPDPLLSTLRKGISKGYVENNTETKQATVKTGKGSSSVAGMDHFTQVNGVRTSTAYQNAEGAGPTVVVNGRTKSMPPFQGATPDKIDIYFKENERYVPFTFNGVHEVEGIETTRYLADVEALMVKSEEWNITHTGFAPLQYWTSGVPFFASVPHQPDADSPYAESVTGQSYSAATHSSYLDLEPTTGLPLQARLAMGNNLQMNFTATSYADASNVTKKDLMLPLFWLDSSYRINPESAASLRKAVVTAVVLRRAILGTLVGLGVVCVLIGAALMVKKGACCTTGSAANAATGAPDSDEKSC